MLQFLDLFHVGKYYKPLNDLGFNSRNDVASIEPEKFQSICLEKFAADDTFEEKYHLRWNYGQIGELTQFAMFIQSLNNEYSMYTKCLVSTLLGHFEYFFIAKICCWYVVR